MTDCPICARLREREESARHESDILRDQVSYQHRIIEALCVQIHSAATAAITVTTPTAPRAA